MKTYYNVVLELKTGGFQLLESRCRTAWSKRTALKHAQDCKDKLEHNMFYRKYCAVGITYSDHNAPIEYL